MTKYTSLLTLNIADSGAGVSLYKLLTDSAYSAKRSQGFASDKHPDYVRYIHIENGSGGVVYIASDENVSSTHHFTKLAAEGDRWTDRMEIANGISLSEIFLKVGTDGTKVRVMFDRY